MKTDTSDKHADYINASYVDVSAKDSHSDAAPLAW
jgi:protein tyrosine phosphatase